MLTWVHHCLQGLNRPRTPATPPLRCSSGGSTSSEASSGGRFRKAPPPRLDVNCGGDDELCEYGAPTPSPTQHESPTSPLPPAPASSTSAHIHHDDDCEVCLASPAAAAHSPTGAAVTGHLDNDCEVCLASPAAAATAVSCPPAQAVSRHIDDDCDVCLASPAAAAAPCPAHASLDIDADCSVELQSPAPRPPPAPVSRLPSAPAGAVCTRRDSCGTRIPACCAGKRLEQLIRNAAAAARCRTAQLLDAAAAAPSAMPPLLFCASPVFKTRAAQEDFLQSAFQPPIGWAPPHAPRVDCRPLGRGK